jgi:hypothetical protein
LETEYVISEWFPWMEVGADAIGALAAAAGFALIDLHDDGDRWFVTLERL